ncbi:MAG TPA: hypothetical protein VKV37_05950 [Ktedonobacteraceae bacterium]|nr:hypothetical protein [Ktedonobacteraceae bacterium]
MPAHKKMPLPRKGQGDLKVLFRAQRRDDEKRLLILNGTVYHRAAARSEVSCRDFSMAREKARTI